MTVLKLILVSSAPLMLAASSLLLLFSREMAATYLRNKVTVPQTLQVKSDWKTLDQGHEQIYVTSVRQELPTERRHNLFDAQPSQELKL